MKILAGDVGGTKTRIAVYHSSSEGVKELLSKEYESAAFCSLEQLVEDFTRQACVTVDAACFGVAGPIEEQRVKLTNLSWPEMENARLQKVLQIEKCILVNDLVATASSIPQLKSSDLIELNMGTPSAAHQRIVGVVAPGTGIGHAIGIRNKENFDVLPSEAGHAEFSPIGDLELELAKYLEERFQRVSIERVCSGLGITNIYRFLSETGKFVETKEIREELEGNPDPAIISRAAQDGTSELCLATMHLMVRILGSHVGDMILSFLALGGLYLAGGIPPKIIRLLQAPDFFASCCNKGRMKYLIERTPILLVNNDRAPLIGSAAIAARL